MKILDEIEKQDEEGGGDEVFKLPEQISNMKGQFNETLSGFYNKSKQNENWHTLINYIKYL